MNNNRPSMNTVAERAGVSKATVSYVLNGKAGVSDQTRAKVLIACEEMGYRINPNIQDFVRRTVSGSTRNIAFVLVGKEYGDPAYARLIDGVARATEDNNYHLLFAKLTGMEESIYDLPPILRDGRVDGVVISGDITRVITTLLHQLSIPHVILGNYSQDLTRESSAVELNVAIVGQQIVEQLLSTGRNRIAFFNETLRFHSERQLLSAFKSALSDNGLPVNDEIIYIGQGEFTGAMPVFAEMFKQPELPFDSIYCPDYRSSVEISHLIMAREWVMPTDIVLATIRPYSYYRLPVRSVYVDSSFEEIAYQGVGLLLENISEGESFNSRKIVLSPIIASTM